MVAVPKANPLRSCLVWGSRLKRPPEHSSHRSLPVRHLEVVVREKAALDHLFCEMRACMTEEPGAKGPRAFFFGAEGVHDVRFGSPGAINRCANNPTNE
jgi:hypothetical protein